MCLNLRNVRDRRCLFIMCIWTCNQEFNDRASNPHSLGSISPGNRCIGKLPCMYVCMSVWVSVWMKVAHYNRYKLLIHVLSAIVVPSLARSENGGGDSRDEKGESYAAPGDRQICGRERIASIFWSFVPDRNRSDLKNGIPRTFISNWNGMNTRAINIHMHVEESPVRILLVVAMSWR